MKKNLLLMMLCVPMVLVAQNGVTVSGLAVDAGTVTFNVQWTNDHAPDFVWSDTVWVWVDYNNNGVMERLPVTGATATAGTVTKIPNNDKGVWVAGNARTQGSFSATVKLFTAIKDVGGACVYGSNYPPVGKYTSATEISFTGTPGYDLVFVGGATTYTESGTFTVPPGYTVQSFTDKTGAPGIFTCIPSATYNLTVSATTYCAGSSVTFALSNTTSGRTYWLYKGTEHVNTLTTTGGAATFTGAFAGAGTYTAQVIAEGGNCAAAMTGTHNVSENPLPTDLSLTANPATICNGQSATLTAVATGGASYSIDNSNWQTSTTFNVSPTSTTSYPLYVRTAAGCSTSVTNAATVAVNDVPAAPTSASANSRCGSGTVTFSASVPSGYTIDWYTASDGGALVSGGSGTTSISPSLTATITYYAEARTTSTGCVSASRTAVAATVIASPTTPSLSQNGPTCAGTGVTFTASGGSGSYDWAGAFSGSGSSKTSSTSAGAYTAQVRSVSSSGGVTCYSSYTSSVTGTVSAKATSGQAPGTCGCAAGLTVCNGKCAAGCTFGKCSSDGSDWDYDGGFLWYSEARNIYEGTLTQSCANDCAAAGRSCYYMWVWPDYNGNTAWSTFNCVCGK
jgi:hypothetical protein